MGVHAAWGVPEPPTAEGDGFDTPARPGARYSPRGLVEVLPTPVTPLLWTINAPMYDDAFRRLFPAAAQTSNGLWVMGRHAGTPVLDESALEAAAGTGKLRISSRSTRLRDEVEIVAQAVQRLSDLRVAAGQLSDDALLGYRAHVRALAWRTCATEVAASAAAATSHKRLTVLLRRRLPDEQVEALARDWAKPPSRVLIKPSQRASRSVYGGETWDEAGVASSGVSQLRDPVVRRDFASTRGWLVGRAAREVGRLLALRLRAKDALLELGGEERRLILEVASRLVGRGRLSGIADVQFLTAAELEAALLGREIPSSTEILRRTRGFASFRTPIDGGAGRSTVLRGKSASRGSYTGRVLNLTSADQLDRRAASSVVVTRRTDASWTPVIATAGAIVVETGGVLSHAAIVAREFGTPAVVGVAGATTALRDGELVTVDGGNGTIRRLQT